MFVFREEYYRERESPPTTDLDRWRIGSRSWNPPWQGRGHHRQSSVTGPSARWNCPSRAASPLATRPTAVGTVLNEPCQSPLVTVGQDRVEPVHDRGLVWPPEIQDGTADRGIRSLGHAFFEYVPGCYESATGGII